MTHVPVFYKLGSLLSYRVPGTQGVYNERRMDTSLLTQSTVSGPVCTIWWFVASDTIVAFPVCIASNLFSSLNMNSDSRLSFAFTILKPICKTELELSLAVSKDLCTSPLSSWGSRWELFLHRWRTWLTVWIKFFSLSNLGLLTLEYMVGRRTHLITESQWFSEMMTGKPITNIYLHPDKKSLNVSRSITIILIITSDLRNSSGPFMDTKSYFIAGFLDTIILCFIPGIQNCNQNQFHSDVDCT